MREASSPAAEGNRQREFVVRALRGEIFMQKPKSKQRRFADGRHNARIRKVTRVKCQVQSEMGATDTVWDFYVGPVHHDVIVRKERKKKTTI